jgi:hypothetical protein
MDTKVVFIISFSTFEECTIKEFMMSVLLLNVLKIIVLYRIGANGMFLKK